MRCYATLTSTASVFFSSILKDFLYSDHAHRCVRHAHGSLLNFPRVFKVRMVLLLLCATTVSMKYSAAPSCDDEMMMLIRSQYMLCTVRIPNEYSVRVPCLGYIN